MTQKTKIQALMLGFVALYALAGWDVFRRPNEKVEKGNGFLKKGKGKKALKAYESASKKLGERPRLLYNKGLALFQVGKLEEAEREFLEASTKGDKKLRIHARYNLGNTYNKMAQPLVEEGNKKVVQASQFLKKAKEAGLIGEGKPPKKACALLKKAAMTYKEAAKQHEQAGAYLKKSLNEYKNVLLRKDSHYKAKWNLELSARGLEGTEAVSEEAKRVAKLYGKRCEKDKKKKKKNQQKKNQKKQQQKKNKNQQKKNKNQQKKRQKQQQKKQQKKGQKKKKFDPKEERRKRAKRALDKLQRKQRERRRRQGRTRSPVSRQPVRDW